MKIIVCDDEKAYAENVSQHVRQFFDEQSIPCDIDVFSDSAPFVTDKPYYDLAFLDIEMSPINGLQLAQKLMETNPKILIFMITSYNQYLDEAMDLHIFRYIQKPLDAQRLFSGLQKAMDLIEKSTVCFYLKNQGGDILRVDSGDIIYIEIANRKTKVITKDNEYFSTNSLDYWTEQLPSTSFYKVHSSFIVNVRFITKYMRDQVTLLNQHNIPVSYRKQSAFRQFFFDYCKR